ncbi:MAG: SGNH/GDSL hydrolase family protein, partial [Clostridium butyricum]
IAINDNTNDTEHAWSGYKVSNIDKKVDMNSKEVNSSISDKIRILKQNKQGLYAINLIGDSISHGANADPIYDNSWAGIVRKALQIEFNTNNYGFINAYGRISNNVGRYEDYIFISDQVPGWNMISGNEYLGFAKRVCSTNGAILSCTFKTYPSVNKIGIPVVKDSQSGSIEVSVINTTSKTVTSTYNLNDPTKIEDIIWIDTSSLGDLFKFTIKSVSGTNTITGFYVMDNTDDISFNNYARSGARLEDLSDNVIENIFDCQVLLFALGYNRTSNMDFYLNKCKTAFNKYNPNMYVIDFCWDKSRQDISDKLKEFADSLNVPYVRILDEWVDNSQSLVDSGFLSDTSHPSVEGHRIIAEKILSSIKTTFISKKSIEMFKEQSLYLKNIKEGVISYKGKLDKTDSNYDLFKNIKMAIEVKVNSGTVNELYIKKITSGNTPQMYIFKDKISSSSISRPLKLTKGVNVIENGYDSTVNINGIVEFKDDYTNLISSIPDNSMIKIVNGIVSEITTEKTDIFDYIKYN